MAFDRVDLASVRQKWAISQDQFVKECMLAVAVYCLMYHYVNFNRFAQAAPGLEQWT